VKKKGIKQKLNTEGAELHKMNQKPDLFSGLASSNLVKFACLWAELANITATKDFGNVSAFGKLDVGGEEVSVPVSYLIWMEKQLDDMVPYLIWMEKQLDDMKTFVSGRVLGNYPPVRSG
jgi:hypothetical protein